jgi:hypothetical protein
MREPVLSFLTNGVDPGFTCLPPINVAHSNYPMDPAIEPLALANFQKLIDFGFLEPIPLPPLCNSPVFAVWKATPPGDPPACRNVVDCAKSGINESLRYMAMALPTIRDAIRAAKQGWWAAKFDLKDGFFHVPIHPDWVDLFGVKLPGTSKYARYRVLVFGASMSPAVFQITMMELRRMLLTLGFALAIVIYIDDTLVLGHSKEAVELGALQFKAFMAACGFTLHPAKELSARQRLPFTGVTIDLLAPSLSLPADKTTKLIERLRALLSSIVAGKVDFSAFDSITGKLSHFDYVLKGGKASLAPMHRDKADAKRTWHRPLGSTPRGAKARISSESIASLNWWIARLSAPTPPLRSLFTFSDGSLDCWDDETIPYPIQPPAHVVHVTTDASSIGFGFFIGHPDNPQSSTAGIWNPAQSIQTSNWRETKTIMLALTTLLRPVYDAVVLVDSDNTSAISCTNAGHSSSPSLAALAREIAAFATSHRLLLAARHIPGPLNWWADRLSRATGALFVSAVLTVEFVEWVRKHTFLPCPLVATGGCSAPTVTGIPSRGAVDAANLSRAAPSLGGFTLWVPTPDCRESCINALVKSAKGSRPHALFLPSINTGHRWAKPLRPFTELAQARASAALRLYQAQPPFTVAAGVPPVACPTQLLCDWSLWWLA